MAIRSEEVRQIRTRFYVLALLAGIGFTAIGMRLYGLQIRRGEEFTIKSQENFLQRMRLVADRGLIYDAKGRLLVDNRPALDLYATPAFIADLDTSLETMRKYLDLSEEEYQRIYKRIKGAHKLDRLQAQLIRRDLTRDQLELVEADRMLGRLTGFNVVPSGTRDYRYGKLLAHVTGYLNEIGPQELDARHAANDNNYELGDLLGRRGVERTFESSLRGKDGYEKVVVDSRGQRQPERITRELIGNDNRVPSKPGNNLVLSIDLDLQRAAEKAFGGQAGAVIAVDVTTGFVLAFYATPSYDPNRVTGRLGAKEKDLLDNDPLKPWTNRGVQEQYAPGSTYKPLMMLGALERGFITPQTTYSCTGSFRFGDHTWHCFHDRGQGFLSLHSALVTSCDTFFFQLGSKMGIDLMAENAKLFGLGQRTGIDLDQEITGIVPDEALAVKSDGVYRTAYAINAGVGQGANAFTPLQMVMAYAAIANNGTLFRPQLVKRLEDAEGRVVKTFEPQVVRKLSFKDEYWQVVHSAMCGVVNEPGGTAYSKRQADILVCGKTGTAQVSVLKKRLGQGAQLKKDLELTEYKLRDNAWFIGYAPGDAPKIAVVTITEHGGFGGMASAPTVMAVIRAHLKGEVPGAESHYFRPDESSRDGFKVDMPVDAPSGATLR